MLSDMVYERSGGTFRITVHPGSSLGFKGTELLPAIRDHSLDMAEALGTYNMGYEPMLGFSTLPFIVRDFEEMAHMKAVARPYWTEKLKEWNIKPIEFHPYAPSLFMFQFPVTSMSDLKNVKVRCYEKTMADFFSEIGAVSLTIPGSELYTALQRGLADGLVTSLQTGVEFAHIWEVGIKDVTELSWGTSLVFLGANMDAYEELSDNQKVALLDSAAEIEDWLWMHTKLSDNNFRVVLAENGVKFTTPPAALADEFGEASQFIWDQVLADASPEYQALVDDYLEVVGRPR